MNPQALTLNPTVGISSKGGAWSAAQDTSPIPCALGQLCEKRQDESLDVGCYPMPLFLSDLRWNMLKKAWTEWKGWRGSRKGKGKGKSKRGNEGWDPGGRAPHGLGPTRWSIRWSILYQREKNGSEEFHAWGKGDLRGNKMSKENYTINAYLFIYAHVHTTYIQADTHALE